MNNTIDKTTNEGKVTMSAPWTIYCRKLEELLCQDPDISLYYDADEPVAKLYVDSLDKATILDNLLPSEKTFGNVTLKIYIYPPNVEEYNRSYMFKRLFEGNPVYEGMQSSTLPDGSEVNYILFKKEVAQFFGDNIQNPYGVISTLYESIAKDVFEGDNEGVIFTTALD